MYSSVWPSCLIVTFTSSTFAIVCTTALTLTGDPDAKSTVPLNPADVVSLRNPSTASSTYMKSIRFSPSPRSVNSRWPPMTARIHFVVIFRSGSYGP